ncbi:MAG: hypothetical protein U0Z44_18840 [Kouleothrix sp.]
MALARATHRKPGADYHIGITASVDTFYEGQERSASANPHLLRWLRGITDEYRHLNVLNYEMESGARCLRWPACTALPPAACAAWSPSAPRASRWCSSRRGVAVANAIAIAVRAAGQGFEL